MVDFVQMMYYMVKLVESFMLILQIIFFEHPEEINFESFLHQDIIISGSVIAILREGIHS